MLALKLVPEAIGIGALIGIAIALLGSWFIKLFAGRGWIGETWRQLPIVALAVTCFAAAAACTIIMSVVAHGLSANPLGAVLAGRLKRSGR